MAFAIIKSSVLARENRWDAGFHLALDEVKDRVEELRRLVSSEEAISKLSTIPLSAKAPLLVLMRGGNRLLSDVGVRRVAREYPHLSLAIMEKNLQPAIEKIRARIAADSQKLQHLLAIQTGVVGEAK